MHGVRAKAQYRVQSFPLNQGVDQLCFTVAQTGYIANTVSQMPLPNLQTLDAKLQNITRNDKVAAEIIDDLIPQLAAMKDQKTALENSIAAITTSFDVGFVDTYHTDPHGLDTEALYNLVEQRIKYEMERAQRDEVEAEVQRRVAAAQQGAQPDAMLD